MGDNNVDNPDGAKAMSRAKMPLFVMAALIWNEVNVTSVSIPAMAAQKISRPDKCFLVRSRLQASGAMHRCLLCRGAGNLVRDPGHEYYPVGIPYSGVRPSISEAMTLVQRCQRIVL